MPEYQGGNWIGIGVPHGTPKSIVDLLHKEITAVQDNAEIQNQMVARGAHIEKMNPAEFRSFIGKETEKWGRVVRGAGIKAQ